MMSLTQSERASLFELMKKKFTEEDFFKWVMEKYWNDCAFEENFKGSFEEWYEQNCKEWWRPNCEKFSEDNPEKCHLQEDLLFLLGQKDENRNVLAKYYFANYGGGIYNFLKPLICFEGITLEKSIEFLYIKNIHDGKEEPAGLYQDGEIIISSCKTVCELLTLEFEGKPWEVYDLLEKTNIFKVLEENYKSKESKESFKYKFEILISRIASYIKQKSSTADSSNDTEFMDF